jgi:hypothetical protein
VRFHELHILQRGVALIESDVALMQPDIALTEREVALRALISAGKAWVIAYHECVAVAEGLPGKEKDALNFRG